MVKKLAIISTHPIQYYAPVFQLLAKEITLKVFYTRGENEISQFDNGFKKQIAWDIPLLIGYDYTFVNNTAKIPGTHHFNGIINPTLITEIEAYQADAILVYGWASKSHLKAIRYFSGKIPVYFKGDSTLINQRKGFKNLLKTIFLRFVYRHVNFAFYVGQQNKAYFKKYGLKEEQLIFAPHAIDNDRFSDDRMIEGNALRAKLGIAKKDILILFAGKLESKKNPMLLLEAFIEMGEKSEDGSQKYTKELEVGRPRSEGRELEYESRKSEEKGLEVRSQKSDDRELEDGSQRSEDWVVKENALRQAQGDSTCTNKEQGATSNKQRMMSEDRSQKELEVRRPRSEDWVVIESALRQAQDDSTTTNKEQGATSNKQRMMSEDRSQKELEVRRPRSEDCVGEESALRQAQDDSTTTNKEQGATIDKQRMMTEDRSQRLEAVFDKEKRKTKNEKRPHVHLLFVGNGELEESLKARVESLEVSSEWLGENESDIKCQRSEDQVFNKDATSKRNTHLKSQISNLNSNNIHFMDFQNQTQMPVVYQACDLFCLPSISETWGLAVNEAMACGKAILVSDQVGCHLDLVSKTNGGVFKSGNLGDLKSNLIALTSSKKELATLGNKSKEIIANWNFENQANIISETLNG